VNPIKLRILSSQERGSKTVGAKLHRSKGKQPWSSVKVPKYMLSAKWGGGIS